MPDKFLIIDKELGMDRNFAEVSLWVCSNCGRRWLRYFYEVEAFPRYGRWYLGAIPEEQASNLTASHAKAVLEKLSWYYYGGSYFRGRTGKISGRIDLNP